MEANAQIGNRPGAAYPADVVSDLPPLNAALVGLDTAIEQTEKLAAMLEERLGQVLREPLSVPTERMQAGRYGVPYADSLASRDERLSMANERIGMVLDRLGV